MKRQLSLRNFLGCSSSSLTQQPLASSCKEKKKGENEEGSDTEYFSDSEL